MGFWEIFVLLFIYRIIVVLCFNSLIKIVFFAIYVVGMVEINRIIRSSVLNINLYRWIGFG